MKALLNATQEPVAALGCFRVDLNNETSTALMIGAPRRRAPRALLSLVIVVVATAISVPAQPLYTAKNLGLVPGSSTSAFGLSLSENTYVAGTSLGANGITHAFLYAKNRIKRLSSLESVGNGVNNAGQVVGHLVRNGDPYRRAFLYSNGRLHDLGTLGGPSSEALDINNAGEITGYATTAETNQDHAFIYSRGRMIDLGLFGGVASFGYAINDAGEVAGEYWPTWSTTRAFLYSRGNMIDLGTLGADSIATAINAWGEVTGYSYTEDATLFHAFIYTGGRLVDLGVLEGGFSSAGFGINRWGQVVGTADASSPSAPGWHAFLYAGAMHDLNDLVLDLPEGWVLESATAINDAGQITARAIRAGTSAGEGSHAFLLSPIGKRSTWR